MGDFNVNTIFEFTGTTPLTQQFSNVFLSHYYKKLIKIPIRVAGNTQSLLDNLYTNDPLSDNNGVLMTDITDHYSIFTTSKAPEPIVTKKYCDRRNFDVKKIVEFKSNLRNIDWETKFISGSAQDDFTIYLMK